MGSRCAVGWIFLLGLSACAGPIETRVASTGAGLVASATVLQEDPPISPVAAQARASVIRTLSDRGYAETPDGELQLHVAVAERDAAIAVKTLSTDGESHIAPAKPKKPLQSCADREMRLVVTLTRITDGTEIYRGTAAEYHCKAQMQDVLPLLVSAALADLSKPKGSYKVTRQGLE